MLQAFTEKGENIHYHQRQSVSYYIKSHYVFLLLYETKTEMLEKKDRVMRRLLLIATQGPIIPFTLNMQTHSNLWGWQITAVNENMVETLLTSGEGLLKDGIKKKKERSWKGKGCDMARRWTRKISGWVPSPQRTIKLNGAIIISVTRDMKCALWWFPLKPNYLPLGPTLKVPPPLSITHGSLVHDTVSPMVATLFVCYSVHLTIRLLSHSSCLENLCLIVLLLKSARNEFRLGFIDPKGL